MKKSIDMDIWTLQLQNDFFQLIQCTFSDIRNTIILVRLSFRELIMSTIAYFISDHGFGHATRSVAIIRSLLECDLVISINFNTSKPPLSSVKKSLITTEDSQRVDSHKQSNDLGFISDKDTGKIDYHSTAKEVNSWIPDWYSSYLFDEYRYLKTKGVDLIVSDIAPQPFLLAKM